jgi:hypothetical protein
MTLTIASPSFRGNLGLEKEKLRCAKQTMHCPRPAFSPPDHADARVPRASTADTERDRRRRPRGEHVLAAYVVLSVAALILLRALVDALDFISVGWILVLVFLPLLPRLGGFLKAISPYVQSLKLGALQIDLRAVRREPIAGAVERRLRSCAE